MFKMPWNCAFFNDETSYIWFIHTINIVFYFLKKSFDKAQHLGCLGNTATIFLANISASFD